MKKREKNYGNSGETLVEVMVCAVLFLMLAAVMQGAVSFCTNALHKSTEIRNTNAEICKNLRSGTVTTVDEGSTSYSFGAAASMDGAVTSGEVFTIEVPRHKESVSYGSTQTVDFYLYGGVGP